MKGPRMDTNAHGLQPDLTGVVIGSAFEVVNLLGAGFLEKVYERALIRELALRGVSAKAQVSFPVSYKGLYIGEYVADLVVEETVIVELKCVDRFANEHLAQCINLPESLGPWRGSAPQFSKTQAGMEACPPGRVASVQIARSVRRRCGALPARTLAAWPRSGA